MTSGGSARSERYLYERLSEKLFQQLCNALLVLQFPDVSCFPVGQKDGGRDAVRKEGQKPGVIYQVKWSKDAVKNPVTWLAATIKEETKNIERLVAEGATAYVLMTCIAGTSAPGTGRMDKLDAELAEYSKQFGIPMTCWWRADIDARVESAPRELVWSFSEMLAGQDAVRYVIEADKIAAHEQTLRRLLLSLIATQWEEDAKVKFRQVEMDTYNLLDLYVDVEAVRIAKPRNAAPKPAVTTIHIPDDDDPLPRPPVHQYLVDGTLTPEEEQALGGAAQYLLNATQPLILVRGEPGQGKSTLAQYLCQLHRAAFLPEGEYFAGPRPKRAVSAPRLPLRVDLRDYARWCSGEDPFAEDEARSPRRRRPRPQPTLEKFLAHLIAARSNGADVGVDAVIDVISRFPMLVVLDGLDEVAHQDARKRIVREIDEFAARLGAGATAPQLIVTTRPNASGLAEPSADKFETIALVPLSPDLRAAYLRKWADARGLRGMARRALEGTFRHRSIEPHIAQLADNPMQLTILLYLIQKRGDSVPDGRTQLFRAYMETFLDRESEKSRSVHEHRDDLEEVTAYLGWHLQASAETDPAAGRVPTRAVRKAILNYLDDVEKDTTLVDDLFTAVTDRVWALTSKVQGTFEFDIQTMREYFAASYLWGYAGADLRGFDKSTILGELVRRAYWLNTCRFFAGFANPNELSGLVDVLEEEFDGRQRPMQVRLAAWTLLQDGVFARQTRAQKRATRLFADDLSVRLIDDALRDKRAFTYPNRAVRALAEDRGAGHLVSLLLEKTKADPNHNLGPTRISLATQIGADIHEWWLPHMAAAAGSQNELAWLRCGIPFRGAARLKPDEVARLRLNSTEAAEVAISCGLKAPTGSPLEQKLIRAVLDGHCSEASLTAATGVAGDLIKVLAPWRFLSRARKHPDGAHRVSVGHRFVVGISDQSREVAQRRLRDYEPSFDRVLSAMRVGRGQAGTTSMWSDTARELATLYGPCWLATEIAVIGAASPDSLWTTGGTITRGAEPFGPDPDYGKLLQESRFNRSNADWWKHHFDTYADALSRASWCLALIAVASEPVVLSNLERLDAAVTAMPAEMQRALSLSSSRLGVARLGRRIRPDVLRRAGSFSTLTAMLVAHHSLETNRKLDELQGLTDQQLAEMGRFGVAGWPGLRGLSARMFKLPSAELLDGLRAHGHDAVVGLEGQRGPLPQSLLLSILESPADYPMAWVLAAEQRVAFSFRDRPLAQVAEAWFPRLG
ncbi:MULTISPECIES: NACHT domain-containing NTPase [Micromonospora]|uniref:NACHT domain-containing protein n=1 Tax=Micromonospora solifontis TaxID=2487138 RepID=A0ABX9WNI7_9ACTN|nr:MULTISPECIES: hypothetical protein [Micromonospora]NES14587.1 hypothetical protein [Micromonospora sp. PPF5-17B]NES35275.1 hypothetical protein [Micromonospora solifontis]RNM01003.1 hypothetical protein EFE23_03740 [Micromonospora solifontis]